MSQSNEVKISLRYKLEVLLGVRVNMHECPCNGDNKPDMFHDWHYYYTSLNSGIHCGGAVGRSGWMCHKCFMIEWEQTHEEFVQRLCKSAPHIFTLFTNYVPEPYIDYIPIELWEERMKHRDQLAIAEWDAMVKAQETARAKMYKQLEERGLQDEVRSGNMEGSVEVPGS